MTRATSKNVATECAALRTRMASRAITRAYDEALRPIGLRVTQFTLLNAIKLGTPDSISGLADRLAMERTTLTRNLRLLEREGLITVGPEGHRRARSLHLTEAGERKLEQALPRWREAQDKLVAALGPDRWDDARNLLVDMARAL